MHTLPHALLGASGALSSPASESSSDWVTLVMMGLFLGILLVTVGFYFLTKHQTKKAKVHSTHARPLFDEMVPDNLDLPEQWLAVRSGNIAAVQETLGLSNPRRCSWKKGFLMASVERLFISPPVNGWILVVGPALPAPEEDVDFCFHFLSHISQRLGHVQFFSLNRALGHHCWVRAHTGRIERAYAWCGETLWNQGKMTPEESALKMTCHPYGRSIKEIEFQEMRQLTTNTENISRLAARWSLNPAALKPEVFASSTGITGDLFPATSESETE